MHCIVAYIECILHITEYLAAIYSRLKGDWKETLRNVQKKTEKTSDKTYRKRIER